MMVFRRMLGRELPCTVAEILGLSQVAIDPAEHRRLREQVEDGIADAWRLHLLGLSHAGRGEWGCARACLNQAARQRPDLAAIRLALAQVDEKLGAHEESARQIDAILLGEAHSMSGCELISRRTLLDAAGLAWELSGQPRLAAERYRESACLAEGDAFARYRLIALALAGQRFTEACRHLRVVLEEHPGDQAARVCLGHLLLHSGHPEESAWQYEQALCLDPDTWEAHDHEDREPPTEDSLRRLQQLVEHQPHFADLRLRLGSLYSRLGRDSAAREELETALTLHPDYLEAHLALARHELAVGHIDAACIHLQRSATINSRHVEACAGLGLALRARGLTGQAQEMLASASRIAARGGTLRSILRLLEEDTDHAGNRLVWQLLAEHDGRGQWIEKRLTSNARMLKRNPRRLDLAVESSALLRNLRRPGDAAELLQRVARHAGWSVEARREYGFALLDQRGDGDGPEHIAQSLQPGEDLALDYRVALIYNAELEFNLSMECFDDDETGREVQRRVWEVVSAMDLEKAVELEEASVE